MTLCAAGTAMVGLLTSFLGLGLVAAHGRAAIVGSSVTVDLDEIMPSPQGGLYFVIVAAVFLLAAVEYGRRRRRGIYVHILAILLLLPALTLALNGAALLAVSLAILAVMAAWSEAKPALIITAAGLGLTVASTFFQQMGPEIGQYGTECVPIENCFGPLLGGGYPIQYIVNSPGITDPTSLGSEDEFRPWALALDAVFYIAASSVVYALLRYQGARRGRRGSPAER